MHLEAIMRSWLKTNANHYSFAGSSNLKLHWAFVLPPKYRVFSQEQMDFLWVLFVFSLLTVRSNIWFVPGWYPLYFLSTQLIYQHITIEQCSCVTFLKKRSTDAIFSVSISIKQSKPNYSTEVLTRQWAENKNKDWLNQSLEGEASAPSQVKILQRGPELQFWLKGQATWFASFMKKHLQHTLEAKVKAVNQQ